MKNKIIFSYVLSALAIIGIIGVSLAYFTSNIDQNNSSSTVRTASLGNVEYIITSPEVNENILPGWEGNGSTSVYFTSSSDYSTNYYCTIRLLSDSLQNNVYVKTTGEDGQAPTMILLTEEETVISRGILLPEVVTTTGEKHITNYTIVYRETGQSQNSEMGSTIKTHVTCYSDETEGTALDVLSGTVLDLSGNPIANQAMVIFSSPTYFITDNEGKYTVRVERGSHNIYYVPNMTMAELQEAGTSIQTNGNVITKTIEAAGTDKNKNIIMNVNEPTVNVTVTCTNCTSDINEKVVTKGEDALFEITANEGYTLKGATVTGEGCALSGSTLTLINVTTEKSCQVTAVPAERYVYWHGKDGGSGTSYEANSKPNVTYESYSEMIEKFHFSISGSWTFMRTTVNGNGTVTGHETCLYYNSSNEYSNHKIFCLGPNYWTGTNSISNETEGVNTMNKLKAAMDVAFQTTETTCDSFSTGAYCEFDNSRCNVYYTGEIECNDQKYGYTCSVNSAGTAKCRR